MKSITKGVFLSENKGRFLCEVEVNGIPSLCYIPSTCRLDKLLSLQGKEVLLLPTSMPDAKTEFSLFAVRHKANYIILNSSMANRLVEHNFHSRRFSFLGKRTEVFCEYTHDGYKCDLFVNDTKTIVEVKSIISASSTATLFIVDSRRAMRQIDFIRDYMSRGFPVCYIVVSLNPYTKEIVFNQDNRLHSDLLSCVSRGMMLYCLSCCLDDGMLKIKSRIKTIIR